MEASGRQRTPVLMVDFAFALLYVILDTCKAFHWGYTDINESCFSLKGQKQSC